MLAGKLVIMVAMILTTWRRRRTRGMERKGRKNRSWIVTYNLGALTWQAGKELTKPVSAGRQRIKLRDRRTENDRE